MPERILTAEIPAELYNAMNGVEQYLKTIDFERGLLELLRLRAAQINGCAYCTEMHHLEAAAAGESEQRLYSLAVWRETPFYTDKERAILEWTERLTLLADNEVDTDLMEQMQHDLSTRQIIDLTMAVAQTNSWNRIAKTFGFQPGHYRVGMHD